MSEYSKATEYFKEALEIEPSNLSIYYQLINLEFTRHNLAGANKYINESFKINYNDAILLALKGESYYRLGLNHMSNKKWSLANEKFQKSIEIWIKTKAKTNDSEWLRYVQEGILRAEKNIEEISKVTGNF